MAQYARSPPELSSKEPMNENWRNWKHLFLIFLKVSGAINETEDFKANLLINLIGPVGQQIFQKFDYVSPTDKENMDILLQKFDEYFDPKKSEAYERYHFFSSAKKNGQSIEQYVKELRIKAAMCNFGDHVESFIRDKIILDFKNHTIIQLLLRKPELNLPATVEILKSFEGELQLQQNFLNHNNSKLLTAAPSIKSHSAELGENRVCCRCGESWHATKCCTAMGKKCQNCGMNNHLTKCCIKPSIHKPQPGNSNPGNANTGNSPQTPILAQESVPTKSAFFNPGPISRVPERYNKNSFK